MTAAATADCNCTSAVNIAIDMASTTAASYGRWVHRGGEPGVEVMVMSLHGFGDGTSNVPLDARRYVPSE